MEIMPVRQGLRPGAQPGHRDMTHPLFAAQFIPAESTHQYSILLYQRRRSGNFECLADSVFMSAITVSRLSPAEVEHYHREGYMIFNRPVLPEEKFAGLRGCFENGV